MAAKRMFQVRNDAGHLRTVMAASHRGAVKAFVAKYKTLPREEIDVKERGEPSSDWQRFRVS